MTERSKDSDTLRGRIALRGEMDGIGALLVLASAFAVLALAWSYEGRPGVFWCGVGMMVPALVGAMRRRLTGRKL